VTLEEIHNRLSAALAPLGIEVGPEVLSVWLDLRAHGQDPLTPAALIRLARVADELLADTGVRR